MRTLVVSDLHLGQGLQANPAGARALSRLLDGVGEGPLRIVLNGDTFEGEGQAFDERAHPHEFPGGLEQARALTHVARVVEAGGELLIRTCERVESYRSAALARIHAILRISPQGQRRVAVQWASTSGVLEISGVRIVVTRPCIRASVAQQRLLVELLEPLRRNYGTGIVEHLLPDLEAAALGAIAVNPTAVRLTLCERASSRRHDDVASWMATLIGDVALETEERGILLAALDPECSLAAAEYTILDRARAKILRHCLAQRVCDARGLRQFASAEVSALRRGARSCGASAVLVASSHLPAWSGSDGLVVVDTGSWVDTVRVPPDTGEEGWRQMLDAWERLPRRYGEEPALAMAAGLRSQFTAALVEPRAAGGVSLSLLESAPGRQFVRLCEAALPLSAS